MLVSAVDACSSQDAEGCAGCMSRGECRRLWDEWVDADLGAGDLYYRLSLLESLPGWRLPAGCFSLGSLLSQARLTRRLRQVRHSLESSPLDFGC